MLRQVTDEHEGALLRRLKSAGQSGRMARIGFATGDADARRRALVIVARITQRPDLADGLRALVEVGAEAVEIVPRTGGGSVADIVNGAGVPCGLVLAADSETGGAELADTAGLDWIHLISSAPAQYLTHTQVNRLVDVVPDMQPGRLSGLGGLKIDAVVISGSGDQAIFTVDTLTAVTAVQTATKGPVLLGQGLGLLPRDAGVLVQHGIEGIIVDGVDTVRAWAREIDRL